MERVRSKNFRPGRLSLRVLPVLVWVVAIGGVVYLFHHRAERFEVVGIAQGRILQISATVPGRLKSVDVELFDEVRQGQVLAAVDTALDPENERALVQAQLNTVLAEIQHLMAELVPTQDRLLAEELDRQSNRFTAYRRFSVDIENARLRVLELRTLIETDKMALEDLALEVKIAQDLVEEEAVVPYVLQKAQVQHNTLAKKIEENEHLLDQARLDVDKAQKRRDEFVKQEPYYPSADSALDIIHKAIKVQEQRIEELLVERVPMVLKAPFDGVVSQILQRPGATVLAGVPILTVAAKGPTEVIAYAGENQLNQIQEMAPVKLIKNSRPPQVAGSQVVYLGPTVEMMPQQLWRDPGIPQWGRPILIKIPPGMKLVPGERVGVRGL